MTPQQSLKVAIDRVLKRFSDPVTPELSQFISGVNDAGAQGSIDDGNYGDPSQDNRPEHIIKDDTGWLHLRR